MMSGAASLSVRSEWVCEHSSEQAELFLDPIHLHLPLREQCPLNTARDFPVDVDM